MKRGNRERIAKNLRKIWRFRERTGEGEMKIKKLGIAAKTGL